jgi:hypothetical protein
MRPDCGCPVVVHASTSMLSARPASLEGIRNPRGLSESRRTRRDFGRARQAWDRTSVLAGPPNWNRTIQLLALGW